MTAFVSNAISSRPNDVVIKLGEAIDIVSGAPFKSELFNEVGDGLPLIRVRDVNTGPAGVYYSGEFSNDHLIKNGDLLVSMDGDFKAVRWMHGDALLNQRVCKISSKDEILSSRYLECFLPNALQAIHRDTTFTTVKHLSVKAIKDIDISLPPIQEQIRIAHLLGKVEALIAQRKQHLQQLDDLLKSVFLEMFGDPVRNEKGWDILALQLITSKIGSGATPSGGNDSYKSEGISLIRSLNIHDRKFLYKNLAFIDESQAGKLKNVVVQKNDVLLNITGASVCRCALVPLDILPARVNQHVAIIRPIPEALNSTFLESLLISDSYKGYMLKISRINGATREALTKDQLEKLQIYLPPINLQVKFANISEKVEIVKCQYQKSLSDLKALYGALTQQAFKGELDLSRAALNTESVK